MLTKLATAALTATVATTAFAAPASAGERYIAPPPPAHVVEVEHGRWEHGGCASRASVAWPGSARTTRTGANRPAVAAACSQRSRTRNEIDSRGERPCGPGLRLWP
jgi:hypothetical protein